MNKTSVVVYLTLAFLVYTIGRSPDKGFELPPAQQLAAWGVLAFTLALLVDMNETAQIGDALVVLLLVSILLTYGEGMIKWITLKVGASPTSTTTVPHGAVSNPY